MRSAARRFVYAPFGQTAPAGALACDGLVEGDAFHLSHWPGNHTRQEYKADTSVEIALRYVQRHGGGDAHDAIVSNNHFDTDGALAVWVLLEPETAMAHRELIIAAAEAGDFEEWPRDKRGLWLEIALRAMARRAGDGREYEGVLGGIAGLLTTIEKREDLWGEGFRELLAERERARAGAVRVERAGNVAVLRYRAGERELPGAVLTAMVPGECTRWLNVFERAEGKFEYRYERPRWAWADTVQRATIAAPSRNAIARELGDGWALKGDLGMTGLLRSNGAVALPPDEVVARLRRNDPGAG